MKILITGVAGRVGSSLAQRLVRSGHDVRGTVRPGGRELHRPLRAEVECVEAALSDTEALTSAVSGADVVVHLAAQMVIGDTAPDRFFDVNVGGTLRLLEASVNQPTPVQRFVFASTDNTYGPARPQATPITEEHPQLPGDYYGTSKVLAEQLVKNYHELHGLEYSILRYGSVLAPNEALSLFRLDWVRAFLSAQASAGRRGNLWPLFADRDDLAAVVDAELGVREDNPAVVLTGPDDEAWAIHLTDVRDVVAGTVLGIERSEAANREFNIVGPHTTTFSEAAAVMAKRFDLATVTVQLPVKLAFDLSTAKARDMLGYSPSWDFDGIVSSSLSDADDEVAKDYVPVGAG